MGNLMLPLDRLSAMQSTIANASQLEEALAKMRVSAQLQTDTVSNNNSTEAPADKNAGQSNIASSSINSFYKPQNSDARISTSQASTSGYLMNLNALQTTQIARIESTNSKIETLTNAVYNFHNELVAIRKHQEEANRQTVELLSIIARNTASFQINTGETFALTQNENSKLVSIKDYGFGTVQKLFGEFLYKLLEQIKQQIINKNKGYVSTRDFNSKTLSQVVNISINNEFKINDIVEDKIAVGNAADPRLVKIAQKVGSNSRSLGSRILSPEAFREIFNDVESQFFISCFRRIVKRMKIIKIIIPFYESDIIDSIKYPYFNENNDIICNWKKISPRTETKIEAAAISATITDKQNIAKCLAAGMSESAAIKAVLG